MKYLFYRRFIKITLRIFLLAAINTGHAQNIQDTIPRQLTLHYALHWKGLTGKANYILNQNGTHYTIISDARGTGIASMLGKAVMTSEGSIEQGGILRPNFFKLDKPFGEDEQTIFDWKKNSVTLKTGEIFPLGKTAIHDPLSLLFQFYWTPPDSSAKSSLQNIKIATTKKLAAYTFKLTGTEQLKFNKQSIETQVWKRYDAEGKLHMTLWLAPSQHFIPIKMHDYDGANEIKELVLTGIETK